METLDHDACYQIFRARDARFDGRIFVGVISTGVYCRPICPATSPKPGNCRFFRTAAAAQEAGFRPCLRCRPELAPDAAPWRGGSALVARGLALIANETESADPWTTAGLARVLDVSERQLRRVFLAQLGASPSGVMRTQRVLRAKQLIHDTRLTMTQIAFAAGFGSIRQFNETFQRLYGRTPGSLRRSNPNHSPGDAALTGGVVVRLRYRPPYDWQAMLNGLSGEMIPGIEQIVGGDYQRTIFHGGAAGAIEIRHAPAKGGLLATIWHPDFRALPSLVIRIRRFFDLDSDPAVIGAHLARDPLLEPMLKANPGVRVRGSWDGFETAVRVILSWNTPDVLVQRRRFEIAALGSEISFPDQPALIGGTRLFPTPSQIANADFSALPGARPCEAALIGVAREALAVPTLFETIHHTDDRVRRLQGAPGLNVVLGKRIADAIDGEPDQFDAPGAPGLPRGLVRIGPKMDGSTFEERSNTWRPWRAYALHYAAMNRTEGQASLASAGTNG